MEKHLISKELDDLLLLEVLNEDLREQTKLLSLLISSIKETSPRLSVYEQKKKHLMDLVKSEQMSHANLNKIKEKLVKIFFILRVVFSKRRIGHFSKSPEFFGHKSYIRIE